MREAGHNVQAVRELGLREAEDSDIWDYALTKQTAVITKDQDFAARLPAQIGMARQPRIEFEGAIYHIMIRVFLVMDGQNERQNEYSPLIRA